MKGTKLAVALQRALVVSMIVLSVGSYASGGAGPNGQTRRIPDSPLRRSVPEGERLTRYHAADYSAPISHVPIPQHPFMAPDVGNNMHNDAYMSDAYEASGPLGLHPEVSSRTQGFGGYGTVGFDSAGRIVAVYSNARAFQLELMDAVSLQELASYDLPPRPWYFLLQGVMPWEYIGAGVYFYLDDQDRAIVPTTGNTVQVVQVPGAEGGGEFRLVREYDLADYVVPVPWPKQDSVAWVLPDWGGEFYWFATTLGVVGTIQMDSGAVQGVDPQIPARKRRPGRRAGVASPRLLAGDESPRRSHPHLSSSPSSGLVHWRSQHGTPLSIRSATPRAPQNRTAPPGLTHRCSRYSRRKRS